MKWRELGGLERFFGESGRNRVNMRRWDESKRMKLRGVWDSSNRTKLKGPIRRSTLELTRNRRCEMLRSTRLEPKWKEDLNQLSFVPGNENTSRIRDSTKRCWISQDWRRDSVHVPTWFRNWRKSVGNFTLLVSDCGWLQKNEANRSENWEEWWRFGAVGNLRAM